MNSTFHLVVEVVVAAAIKHNIFIKKSQLKFRREWERIQRKFVYTKSRSFLFYVSLAAARGASVAH